MNAETKPTLADRVLQFHLMELPGQPMMMHMGTSYLVNDLWSAHNDMAEALRPFAMTAASDEELKTMQQEIAPGVMAVVFAAKLDEVLAARAALLKAGG